MVVGDKIYFERSLNYALLIFKKFHKMKKLKLYTLLLFTIVLPILANACTIAVVSGKYTADGRPLLWKNRDTWAVHNQIMFFNNGKYKYVGLVNSGDKNGNNVWIGMNEKGFAIMNSASYNLNIGDTIKQTGWEGRLIKKALANCATVDDFQKMLDNYPRPTRLEANFGVIDGQGNAAMFELGNKGYVKFDANDPKVAPFGYIIRANYSFTGKKGLESSGYIRYNTVNNLFYNAVATNSMSAQFIMQDVSKGLKHSLMNIDLYQKYGNIPQNTPTFTFLHDFVPRHTSASACVIQGVKKGENPAFSLMWASVGFPLTSIAVPIWIDGKNDFPNILKANDKLKDSPECYAALKLKKQLFPIRWGKYASKYYININKLVNADKTGIRQKIEPYENNIFNKTNSLMAEWRKNKKIDYKELSQHYKWIDQYVRSMYKKEFGILI